MFSKNREENAFARTGCSSFTIRNKDEPIGSPFTNSSSLNDYFICEISTPMMQLDSDSGSQRTTVAMAAKDGI